MVDALGDAFLSLMSGAHVLHLAMGVLVGLVVGVLPGLGGTAGMALLLPFVYGMEPGSALALMMGLLAILATADTFPSVLMGIPGSAGSQATVMDGFPLAKAGQGRRALSAAFTASLFGGVFGAVALTFFVLIARPLVLAFGAPELFMLTVFGLSMVGVLSGTNWARGLAACGLGLLLGNLGPAPATGHMRLTFDSAYLSDGLKMVVLALGVFALPEIVDLLGRRVSISRGRALGSGWVEGVRDAFRHRWLMLRSSAIGCIVGAIPGLGGAVVDWIAYGAAVQAARDRSQFGKGDIRGVIAPESANNAKEGGALIPTLIFGIPGSGATAVMLGGFVLIGLQPGPQMISTQLDVVYLMVWSLALANVAGALLCAALATPISKLASLNYAIIAPFMLVIVLFGAFQATRNWGDLIAVAAVGLAGLAFKRFGWPRPPLLIGFVLAKGSEVYLYQSLQLYDFDWLTRPIVLGLIALTILSVTLGVRAKVDTEGADPRGEAGLAAQIGFTALIALAGLAAVIDAAPLPFISRVFPETVGLAVIAFCALSLLLAWRRGGPVRPHEGWVRLLRLDLRYVVWVAVLLVSVAVIGFLPAVAAFTAVFLRVEAYMRWRSALALGLAATLPMIALSQALTIRFPQGIIPLPWGQ